MRWAYVVFFASVLTAQLALAAGEWKLIKIAGRDHVTLDNAAEFYGLGDVQRVNNKGFAIKQGLRSLRGQAGSVEFYINNLKFNLSYPIAEHDGKLCITRMDLTKVVEPVLRPGKIKNAESIDTIILDPGHGGHANGAYSPYGHEKDFALDVAQRTRLLLVAAGYKVHMTRTADVFVPLEERTRFANKFENALFISIHFNSGGAGTGLETYTLAPRGVPSMMADGPRVSDLEQCPGNARDSENIALATATHAALVVRSKMYDRGIKRARFVVIRDIKIPGVLIEGGFLSNSYDAKLIATPAYRQQMASSIVQAIANYRRALAPKLDVASAGPGLREMPTVETSEAKPEPSAPADPAPAAEPTVITPTTN